MKQIEKGSISALVIHVIVFGIIAIIVWPILDLLYDVIFTHSGFVYSVEEHVVKPMIFGCIAGIVFWAIDRVAMKRK